LERARSAWTRLFHSLAGIILSIITNHQWSSSELVSKQSDRQRREWMDGGFASNMQMRDRQAKPLRRQLSHPCPFAAILLQICHCFPQSAVAKPLVLDPVASLRLRFMDKPAALGRMHFCANTILDLKQPSCRPRAKKAPPNRCLCRMHNTCRARYVHS